MMNASLSTQQMMNAVDAVHAPIVIVDRCGVISWCNSVFSTYSGHQRNTLVGTPIASIIESGRAASIDPVLASDADILADQPHFPAPARPLQRQSIILCAGGSRRDADETITAIFNGAGVVTHFISILHDRAQAQQALLLERQRAARDSLTGVATRDRVLEALRSGVADAAATGTVFGVLFVDLDGFKLINDRFGHPVGDCLLSAVGSRLMGAVRASDTVGRYGGDEFVVLLPRLPRRRTAELVGVKLVEQLTQPYVHACGRYRLGASVGLAFFPDHGKGPDAIIASADAAMYRAKRAGGSSLVIAARDGDDTRRGRRGGAVAELLHSPAAARAELGPFSRPCTVHPDAACPVILATGAAP